MRRSNLGLFFGLCLSVPVLATDMTGAWQGDLVIPEGPTLPIGIEVFDRPDGSLWASAASPAQGQRYLPVKAFSVDGRQFRLELASPPATIAGTMGDSGQQLEATFSQGGGELPINLQRVEAIDDIDRPQTPRQLLGYSEKEVWIENNRDGIWLAGSLSIPDDVESAPAVLLLAGSGAAQRDAYYAGHRPMAVLADRLAGKGLVVLRFDKRGVYKSTGQHNPVAIDDTLADAQSALAYLRAQPVVDAKRLAVIGHSEGALIAGMLASSNDLVSAVSLAGPGMPIIELLQLQDATEALAAGASEQEASALSELTGQIYVAAKEERNIEVRMARITTLLQQATELQRSAFEQYNGGTGTLSENWLSRPKYSDFLMIDPQHSWGQVTEPVLVINGLADSQVPAEQNVKGIVDSVKGPVSVCTPENVNHMLQPAASAATADYAEITQTIAEPLLNNVISFVRHNSGLSAQGTADC